MAYRPYNRKQDRVTLHFLDISMKVQRVEVYRPRQRNPLRAKIWSYLKPNPGTIIVAVGHFNCSEIARELITVLERKWPHVSRVNACWAPICLEERFKSFLEALQSSEISTCIVPLSEETDLLRGNDSMIKAESSRTVQQKWAK
jgi:hypothetical protein